MAYQIMIVDDSRVVHSEIQKLLEGSCIEVARTCRCGEEALEAYEFVRPDLVTLDIIMPGMDGLETAKAILSRWPDSKIVMISSLAFDDTMEAAKSIGTKGFIFKPFEREKLISQLLDAIKS